MKWLTLLFLFILSPALLFTEETPQLKLRVARHPFLKSPARLVTDIYQEEEARGVKRIESKKGFLKSKVVIIDPGHGGYEYGLIKDNQREKDVVLDIAKRLRALIIKGSAQCFLTRMGDYSLSLQERANFSNNKNGDIFLSLHIGRHKDIVIYTPVITESTTEDSGGASIKKTGRLQDAIKSALGEDMVSIKPLPYSVLSKVKGVSLVIELPFFEDVDYNKEFKAKLATTIYKGLYLYEEVTTD